MRAHADEQKKTDSDSRIQSMHSNGRFQIALCLTGGGTSALSFLLGVPGASATVLDALVPYSKAALCEVLGRTPESFVSASVATDMATLALVRATRFANSKSARAPLGVACTAELKAEPPHANAFVSFRSDGESVLLQWRRGELVLSDGLREVVRAQCTSIRGTRQQQEQALSENIVRVLEELMAPKKEVVTLTETPTPSV